MNLFSKLFSSSNQNPLETPKDELFEELKLHFNTNAEFYSHITLFNTNEKKTIDYLMIHPQAGIVLFSFFNYTSEQLQGVTVSLADEKSKDADIKTSDDKSFIELRFEEIFHTQICDIRSILICANLNEGEFDYLHQSFHQYIPKSLSLFNDSSEELYQQVILGKQEKAYDMSKIKQALFAQFIVPEKNVLMSAEQQAAISTNIVQALNIKGLPGSGKSSVLVAKALHEKMKDPRLDLIFFCKLSCNVHILKALIFKFIENSHWNFNPADIKVSSFESLKRRLRNKEKYDLIVCDDINIPDLELLKKLLDKSASLLVSSSYEIEDVPSVSLMQNYRLPSALCAACEGLEVETISDHLDIQSGNTYMNTLLILEELLKDVPSEKITLIHYSKDELFKLQTEIDSYFTPITYLFDDPDKKEGLLLYPLTHISCIVNDYIIVITDENVSVNYMELISRSRQKSFILSESQNIHQLINHIKGENNEPD